LPTIDELQGIYDANANVGGYYVKGNLQLSNWWQWSSSRGNTSVEAGGFNFHYGERNVNLFGNSRGSRALCVRGSAN
jgi:hypothetical protein